MNEDESPFSPGKPVSPELFVGRKNKIKEIVSFMEQSAKGNHKNIFLSGNRGFGKSSLANYLRSYAEKNTKMLCIHILLGGVTTTEELVNRIFEGILNESYEKEYFDRVYGLFESDVKEVGLAGVPFTFEPSETKLKGLTKNFFTALAAVISVMKNEVDGLFISLDDLDGLAYNRNFADWYKSYVDMASMHFRNNFPVFMMLIGLPDRRDALINNQESLNRILTPIEMNNLSINEVEEFYKKAFHSVGIKIDDDALEFMLIFGGYPVIMHEIGDAIFDINQDKKIDKKDARDGVNIAAARICEQNEHIKAHLHNIVTEELYKPILRKIFKHIDQVFTKQEIVDKLDSDEKSVFDELINHLEQLEIIKWDQGDVISFIKPTSPAYIKMRSYEY